MNSKIFYYIGWIGAIFIALSIGIEFLYIDLSSEYPQDYPKPNASLLIGAVILIYLVVARGLFDINIDDGHNRKGYSIVLLGGIITLIGNFILIPYTQNNLYYEVTIYYPLIPAGIIGPILLIVSGLCGLLFD
ncbi:MAG: hypothetical protein ACTSVV_09750 [Promethearchaeota archaeon]